MLSLLICLIVIAGACDKFHSTFWCVHQPVRRQDYWNDLTVWRQTGGDRCAQMNVSQYEAYLASKNISRGNASWRVANIVSDGLSSCGQNILGNFVVAAGGWIDALKALERNYAADEAREIYAQTFADAEESVRACCHDVPFIDQPAAAILVMGTVVAVCGGLSSYFSYRYRAGNAQAHDDESINLIARPE